LPYQPPLPVTLQTPEAPAVMGTSVAVVEGWPSSYKSKETAWAVGAQRRRVGVEPSKDGPRGPSYVKRSSSTPGICREVASTGCPPASLAETAIWPFNTEGAWDS